MEDSSKIYFEDFGSVPPFESESRTITDVDVEAFAALSADTNPLHLDANYAATTPFGKRIAHGLLVLSMATGLAHQLDVMNGTVEAFMEMRWQYRAPVLIGDTIKAMFSFHKKRAMPGYAGGLVELNVKIVNQLNQVVQKGVWVFLVRSRASTAAS